MSPLSAAAALAGLALTGACAGADANDPAPSPIAAVAWANVPLGLELTPARGQVIDLAWRPPGAACPEIYRITVDHDYTPQFERALGITAEERVKTLALAADPHPGSRGARSPRGAHSPALGPAPWTGHSLYLGPKTGDRQLLREVAIGPSLVGPASPDAACFERTWDPVEDALALGWPALPGRPVAVGERWTGARVESRCNRSACADPKTGAGGEAVHDQSCVTMAWRETLEGIYEVDGHRVAAITSYWSDGQPPELGIWSERSALIAGETGRLIVSEALIHHNRYGITRSLRIEAIDGCPGGLHDLGGAPRPLAELDSFAGAAAAAEAVPRILSALAER